jgi:hypothetical protein
MINPDSSLQCTMMAKFRIYRRKEEFKAEIPILPQVGEKITIHEAGPDTYEVKSIEHEIKGGIYNANIILSAATVK